MNDITIILLILSIGLFLARYVLKKSGVDVATIVFSICGLAATLKDSTIPSDDLLIYAMPTIFVMMVSLCSYAFDREHRY